MYVPTLSSDIKNMVERFSQNFTFYTSFLFVVRNIMYGPKIREVGIYGLDSSSLG